ncbi:unnamed protein product [Prunus brigantina]
MSKKIAKTRKSLRTQETHISATSSGTQICHENVCFTNTEHKHEAKKNSGTEVSNRAFIVQQACSSGSSADIECSRKNVCHPNNENKHSDNKKSRTSHKKAFQAENKKRKCVQNICFRDINTSQTIREEISFDTSDQMNKGQAFYQRKRQRMMEQYVDFGDKNYKCIYCGALFWFKESIKKTNVANEPLFTLCCQQGKIKLPISKPTPPFLENLLDPDKGPKSLLFRENIRAYNSMFAFTSMGAKVDHSINSGQGPYIFKISGQVHHLMGSLLPLEGECPKFAQLYIYDTHNETMNCLNAVNCEQKNEKLDEDIVQGLIRMFDESNELVKLFRTVRDKFEGGFLTPLKLRLLGRQTDDGKQYEQPTCDEIGGLVVGDIGLFDSNRDIVVELQAGELKRITKLNPKFMSLQYPILFPYGEDGYTPDLKWSNDYKGHKPKRGRGDSDANNVGQKVILPSSYTGSTRYMLNNYQDAMAICRHYGNPDLFITFPQCQMA